MKLAVINGSPRNKKSNSKLLIDNFLLGYKTICNDEVPIHYIANIKQMNDGVELFKNAEIVIIIFPLYTDSMPGIVKEFFEHLFDLNDFNGKKLGFIVQSGFPEPEHSIHVEKYLKKFASRINCQYLGTVIKGGVEGIQIMPPSMTKKLFANFYKLGVYFVEHYEFSPEIRQKMMTPLNMSKSTIFIYKIMKFLGLTNFYWNSNLKKHGAFNKRFDAPYKDLQV